METNNNIPSPKSNRIIGGVCDAIAKKYKMAVVWVRIIFVVSAFLIPLVPLLIYIILWIRQPKKDMPDISAEESTNLLGSRFSIKSRNDIVKIPIGLIGIALLGISPFIVGGIVTMFEGCRPCNEGNSIGATIPWLCLLTLPAAFFLGIVFLLQSIKQVWQLKRL
jgi:phage shock protein PspC (stress-responsive transcriptional regulator)